MIIILHRGNPLFHLTVSRFVPRFEKIGGDSISTDVSRERLYCDCKKFRREEIIYNKKN